GKAPVQRAVEVADGDRAINDDGAVRLLPHALDVEVVLVRDVTDDFLDDVFKRHQAFELAIFIDHDGEMGLAAQECVELLQQGGGIRHEPRLRRDLHHVDPRGVVLDLVKGAQQILGVDDADNVVCGTLPERHARVRAVQDLAHHDLRGIFRIDRTDLGAVNHHVRNFELVQIKQATHAVAILLDREAVAVEQRHRVAQLFARAEALLYGGQLQTEQGQERFSCQEQRDENGEQRQVEDERDRVDHHAAFPVTVCRNASTSDEGTSLATKDWPMPRVRMKVSAPRETFLSCAMKSSSFSGPGRSPG